MIVERTDFISVPVTDMERATQFYEETLGLPRISERGFPQYPLGENVSVYLIRMEDVGSSYSGPHTAHVALRVADVAETRRELEAKGVEFEGDRHPRHERVPHGVLQGPGRQPVHAPPEVRAP